MLLFVLAAMGEENPRNELQGTIPESEVLTKIDQENDITSILFMAS